jgi:hypothetical protein
MKTRADLKYTEQLIQARLMQHFKPRQNTVVPNVYWGMDFRHECDVVVVTPAGVCTEIEIKVSRADLLNDCKKPHHHEDPCIHFFYFCVPESLEEIALESIPESAGLITVVQHYYNNDNRFALSVKAVKKPIRRQKGKWPQEKIAKLERLGRLRAYDLLVENIKLKYPVLL